MMRSEASGSVFRGIRADYARGWRLIVVCYVALNITVLAGLGAMPIARHIFAVTSVLAGLCLYQLYGPAYASFTIVVWLVSPLVRRLIDYRVGWENPNIVLLTPYLVTAISGLSLLGMYEEDVGAMIAPIGLMVTGIACGVVVGFFRAAWVEVALGSLEWITPIVFGLYLVSKWRDRAVYRRAVSATVVGAAVVMSLYGIVQFITAPAWDGYWVENVTPDIVDPSFGQPLPFQIRVFSTTNSPGMLASALIMALILLVARRRIWPALPIVTALMLSEVRTAWLGLIVGAVLSLKVVGTRFGLFYRRRLAAIGAIVLAAIIVLGATPIASDLLASRLHTFNELKADDSVAGRVYVYGYLVSLSLREPLGAGLTQRVAYKDLALDGVLQQLLVDMGLPGTVLFAAGIGWLLYLLIQAQYEDADSAVIGVVALMFIAMAPAATVFYGPLGVLSWTAIGLSLSTYIAVKNAQSGVQGVQLAKSLL